MNKDIEVGDIARVSNWLEVYDEIEKYRREKKD